MRSNGSTRALSATSIVWLVVLACVLPIVILFTLVRAGFSPPPVFVFFLLVVAPLMALRMTFGDETS